MGVFDFVKNAGAKIGIGKSTQEEAAEEAAAAAEAKERAEAAAKRAAARREARKKAADKSAARAEAKKEAMAKNAEAARKKAAAKERMAEYKKSNELEQYIKGLGIDASGVDIRFDNGTAYITGEVADQATRERIILAVGNAQGVGKVDEEITVEDPAEEAHFHTVAPGDTLWAVAEKVYGDGSRYTEIFEANKPMLSNPDLIFPGQVLRCPMDDE
jgi:nucleoid-associated protein YgaU